VFSLTLGKDTVYLQHASYTLELDKVSNDVVPVPLVYSFYHAMQYRAKRGIEIACRLSIRL